MQHSENSSTCLLDVFPSGGEVLATNTGYLQASHRYNLNLSGHDLDTTNTGATMQSVPVGSHFAIKMEKVKIPETSAMQNYFYTVLSPRTRIHIRCATMLVVQGVVLTGRDKFFLMLNFECACTHRHTQSHYKVAA